MAALAVRSLFCENSAAHQVAESCGFEVIRSYRAVEILDEPALVAAGYLAKPKLDMRKIARDLEAGLQVEGARLKGFEYVLGVRE
jgi:hypothetical protein